MEGTEFFLKKANLDSNFKESYKMNGSKKAKYSGVQLRLNGWPISERPRFTATVKTLQTVT